MPNKHLRQLPSPPNLPASAAGLSPNHQRSGSYSCRHRSYWSAKGTSPTNFCLPPAEAPSASYLPLQKCGQKRCSFLPGIGRLGIKPIHHGRGYPPAGTMDLWHVAMMQHVCALRPYASPPSHESAPPPRGRLEPPAPPCSVAPPGAPFAAAAARPAHGGQGGGGGVGGERAGGALLLTPPLGPASSPSSSPS